MQYDQRFWDRLSVSAGVRAEYYRIDKHYREADTKVFGSKIPFRPVFRAGLNYQLADYSFLRASFGQGYRNPSITEKYLRKDIGGVGVYPNYNVRPEKDSMPSWDSSKGTRQAIYKDLQMSPLSIPNTRIWWNSSSAYSTMRT